MKRPRFLSDIEPMWCRASPREDRSLRELENIDDEHEA